MSNEHIEISKIDDHFFHNVKHELSLIKQKPLLIKTNKDKVSLPKILEIFVHIRIARIIQSTGWELAIYKNINERVNSPDEFKYRGSPGKRSSRNGFHFFRLTSPSKQNIELHLGIQIPGISGVDHELDVGAYSFDTPNDVPSLVHILCEVKRYNKREPLAKNLAREFVGVLADMTEEPIRNEFWLLNSSNQSAQKAAIFISTIGGSEVRQYLERNAVNQVLDFKSVQEFNSKVFEDVIIRMAEQLKIVNSDCS